MSDVNPYEPPPAEDGADAAPPTGGFTLAGCLSVADAWAAHVLAMRGFWLRLIVAVSLLAVVSVVLIALGVSSQSYAPRASRVFLVVGGVILPGLLFVPCLGERMRLHKLARRRLGAFAPTESTCSCDGITMVSGFAKWELQWPVFSRFRANERVAVLFYAGTRQYLIVARSKLRCPGDWPALVDLIRSKVPEP